MEGGDVNAEARIGLVGFRFDENFSFRRGAADAPPLIREALFSDASNLWSETGVALGQPGVIFDAGDIGQGEGRRNDGGGRGRCRRAALTRLAPALAGRRLARSSSVRLDACYIGCAAGDAVR